MRSLVENPPQFHCLADSRFLYVVLPFKHSPVPHLPSLKTLESLFQALFIHWKHLHPRFDVVASRELKHLVMIPP
jgi:hypothetical protein